MDKFKILINEEVFTVESIYTYSHLPMLELDNGTEWYIAESSESAGEAAREYWEDMAENDPGEFTCMVGEKTLVAWALGQYAGPGYSQVQSLSDWLDLYLDVPEEHWGGYDGTEDECRINRNLQNELGLSNECVCYRHN